MLTVMIFEHVFFVLSSWQQKPCFFAAQSDLTLAQALRYGLSSDDEVNKSKKASRWRKK